MLKLSVTGWPNTGISSSSYSVKPFRQKLRGKMTGCQTLLFSTTIQLPIANSAQTIGYFVYSFLGRTTALGRAQQPCIFTKIYRSQCLPITKSGYHTKAQDNLLPIILLPTCSRYKHKNILSTLNGRPVPFNSYKMDNKDTPPAKTWDTKTSWKVPGDMCALAILNTFLTHEEFILAHNWHILSIITNQ